jgi:hypothetical protein
LVLGSRARIRTCRSDCSDVRRSSSSATDRSPTGQALISPESSTPEGHGATGCCGRWDTRLPQVTVCANAVAGVRATSSAIYGLGPTSASGSLNAAVSPGRIPPSEPADVSAGEMDLRSPCAPADEPHIRSGRVQQRHVEEVAALVVGRAVAARMPNQPIYDDLRSDLQHHFRGRIIIAERPTASMSRATVSLSEPNRRGLPRLLHGIAVEACCRHRGAPPAPGSKSFRRGPGQPHHASKSEPLAQIIKPYGDDVHRATRARQAHVEVASPAPQGRKQSEAQTRTVAERTAVIIVRAAYLQVG